jgi:transcriptional regulator with XRE-family HTH domain
MTDTGFGARLRTLREAAGWTQKQLADAAGVSARGVAQWEQGQREPGWSSVVALCRALRVSCETFLETAAMDTAPPKRGRPPKKGGADKPADAAKGKRTAK